MSTLKGKTSSQPINTVAASMKTLAETAMGLVDKQSQLELDNVGLFAQTALFVREVLADIQKVIAKASRERRTKQASVNPTHHMLGSAFEAQEVGDRIILVAPNSIQPVQRIILRLEGAFPHGHWQ